MRKQIHFENDFIHYSIHGKGPKILLIHGFLESNAIWEDVIEKYKNSFEIIAIDIPGHGESSTFDNDSYSMESYAFYIKQLLDVENIKSTYIIGHSLGGYIALAFLELFPNQVDGICLLHSSASEDSLEKKKCRTFAINDIKRNKEPFIDVFIPNLFSPNNRTINTAEITFLKSITKKVSPTNIIKTMTAIRDRIDRNQVLSEAKTNKYYIIGEDDPVLEKQELIDQAISSNANYTVLNNVGHMSFYEDKKNCLRAIGQFLNNVN